MRGWLGRLLGSDEPELTCDECFAQVDRYVQLEVAAADADALVPGMRGHLANCPACRDEHELLLDFLSGGERE